MQYCSRELMFDKKECFFLATFSRYCWEKNKKNTLKDSKINYIEASTNSSSEEVINFDNVLKKIIEFIINFV